MPVLLLHIYCSCGRELETFWSGATKHVDGSTRCGSIVLTAPAKVA